MFMKVSIIQTWESNNQIKTKDNKSQIKNLIDIDNRENSGSFESVKDAVFPYLTDDYPNFFINYAGILNLPLQDYSMPEIMFPHRKWNGIYVTYTLSWKNIYTQLKADLTHIITMAHIKKYHISEDDLFKAAISNSEKRALSIEYQLEDMNGWYLLHAGQLLTDCSVLLLNEMWDKLYTILNQHYFIVPFFRNQFIICQYDSFNADTSREILYFISKKCNSFHKDRLSETPLTGRLLIYDKDTGIIESGSEYSNLSERLRFILFS